ncbi:MAG: hypothetical protein EBX09_06645 [Actinobacteria bacterium]|nr:hypothetical protein [Actinomycetota bacterium]NCX76697.1 hypothetical protein [Actinomycetota bacterium]
MEVTEILALFNGSNVVCNVCHARSTDAYCARCTKLTEKDTGRPYKWTACTKCGEHYLGVQTSKKCLRITCDGKREICEVQPSKPAKPKPAKKSRQVIQAA